MLTGFLEAGVVPVVGPDRMIAVLSDPGLPRYSLYLIYEYTSANTDAAGLSVAQAKVSTFMRASIMCRDSFPGHLRYALTDAGVC